jgi:two-component system, OmpR family, sensor kinase
MKISNFVLSLVGLVAVFVVALGFISVLAIDRTNYLRSRADLATEQVSVLLELARGASHLSEHAAEHFVFKKPNLAELQHGRDGVAGALEKLKDATRIEVAYLRDRDDVEGEQEDAIRIVELENLFKSAGDQLDQMLALEKQGGESEAIERLESVFNMQIMRPLDDLVQGSIAEERNEAMEARKSAEQHWTWLRNAAIIANSVFFGLVLLLGYGLLRKVGSPIAALELGANEFAAGRFQHRISITSDDELGILAKNFNVMASALEQRGATQAETQQELERQVESRTTDLQHKADELDIANERLGYLNKKRAQFLADISHEVRTPLTTLRGEAELALRLKDKSAKPYRDALTKILSVSDTIGKLVDDLLFLARSETDTLRFAVQSVDLAAIARAALDDAAVLAKVKDIRLRPVIDETASLRAEGDAVRLRQALLIALDNAIKYSPPAKSVDFSLASTGDTAEFTIRDSGPGVAKEDLPFVFERFYRGKTEQSLPGGFGLGLSIAKWIVDKHGGNINLQCPKAFQTELKISLPLFKADKREGS